MILIPDIIMDPIFTFMIAATIIIITTGMVVIIMAMGIIIPVERIIMRFQVPMSRMPQHPLR